MTRPLDPLHLHLAGPHLIEASAGTGKTWTIASLVLRLVLGLGGPVARPLAPREILILTFTRAATKELIDRIRARLVQAQACFEGRLPPREIDPFLKSLVSLFPEGRSRQEAAWLLARAASSMDDAAVFTIDAWVQRVLREHLMPLGQTAPDQVLESHGSWLQQAVQDYWRQQVYPLDSVTMQAVSEVVSSPEALLANLWHPLHSEHPKPPKPALSLHESLASRCQARRAQLRALQDGWVDRAAQIREWFAARLQANPRTFNGNALRGGMDAVGAWCETLSEWAKGESAWLPGVNVGKPERRRLRERLTPSGLMALHNTAARPTSEEQLPGWAHDFQRLVEGLDALDPIHESLSLHALGWVADRLAQVKTDSRSWTFDDLLDQATARLRAQPAMARAIRQQHPAAMVDEFQDTAPRQLTLISEVYPLAAPPAARALDDGTSPPPAASAQDLPYTLLLIGDPKQSIYRFRGADIHAYLKTRQALADRLHTLDCNRRTTADGVRVVNHLFSQAEARCMGQQPSGAFAHGPDVPFQTVHSQGPSERLVDADGVLPALCLWTEPIARGPSEAMTVDAARAAQRMVRLLNDPAVGFRGHDGGFRRLKARDCCVLVRTRQESQAIRRALWARGIPSAYLSERDSVLQSDEAHDVLDFLLALQAPQDLSKARVVWASASMGLPIEQQRRERDDDALWDSRVHCLQDCAERWTHQGVLAAVRRFVRSSGMADRCQHDPIDGARRLTNWLHLADWLQSWAEQHRTPAALLEAFRRVVAQPERALESTAGLRDTTLLRLESDDDVVQVVTIHKSKGLQYPIVWLPFGISAREDPHRGPPNHLVWNGHQWKMTEDHLDIDGNEDETSHDESLEVLREDVRLLYVALTRAVHQVWWGASPRRPRDDRQQNWHRTALGHLVSGRDQARKDEEAVADLVELWQPLGVSVRFPASPKPAAGACAVSMEILDPSQQETLTKRVALQARGAGNLDGSSTRPSEQHSETPRRPARRVAFPVQQHWRLTSYTALAQGAGDQAPEWRSGAWDEQAPDTDTDTDTDTAIVTDSSQSLPTAASKPADDEGLALSPGGPWHTWPSSAAFGQFVHELLETGAEHGFDLAAGSAWQMDLRARIGSSPWREQSADLERWIGQVVHAPVLPGGGALCSVQNQKPELEFWMPLQGLDTRALDSLLCRHIWSGVPRPPLRPQQVEGFLMGFADLVIESQGRYEVLDYKSNRLGSSPRDYHAQSLRDAVLAHRYDVQAALYLLALHRMLRQRSGGALGPAIPLGAAHFMFLRGIDHPQGCLISIPADATWLGELDALI